MSEADVALIEIWTFRGDSANMPNLARFDLAGYEVEATDGEIGKVDEATYEAGGSYLVVDTGPWIFGKKVMLPAGIVRRVDPDEKRVHVDRTKDEIKNAPEFKADDYDSHRDEVGRYYTNQATSPRQQDIEADRQVRQG